MMGFFQRIFSKKFLFDDLSNRNFALLKKKFNLFQDILNRNHITLKLVSELEELTFHENQPNSDILSLKIFNLQSEIEKMIFDFNELSENKYNNINLAYTRIKSHVDNILFKKINIPKSSYILDFDDLGQDSYLIVGGKNSNLGELQKIGVPIPKGFAITTSAYKDFVSFNEVLEKIIELVKNTNKSEINDIITTSTLINNIFSGTSIPYKLSNEILDNYKNLIENSDIKFVSMRSSAIGEDSEKSFAGQYETILGVDENNLLQSYIDVVASKFTPNAIFYLLNNIENEYDLPMSVGCIQMIDAYSSGVIYSCNPLDNNDNQMIINSIFGLGKLLVDGSISPDSIVINKKTNEIEEKKIGLKHIKLVLNKTGGSTIISNDGFNDVCSINDSQINQLVEIANIIENHYGRAQDIEWCFDKNGQLFILQTRPLQLLNFSLNNEAIEAPLDSILMIGGVTACPGIASGNVFFVNSSNQLKDVPFDCILVTNHPFPAIVTVIEKCRAIITRVGGLASHLVTIAREYRVPTIVGLDKIDLLTTGMEITIDATNRIIYKGLYCDNDPKRKNYSEFQSHSSYNFNQVIKSIIPLNLIEITFSYFTSEKCRTYHDIIRFIHQSSMNEMFEYGRKLARKGVGIKLNSNIPLPIEIIILDEEKDMQLKKNTAVEEIDSLPFKSFWDGINFDGWLPPPVTPDLQGFMSTIATDSMRNNTGKLLEKSFAVVSKEYMLFSLRLGYHFSTIESFCSDVESKNYIKMTFKDGGASFERRQRRIILTSEILQILGFLISTKGDFLDARIDYTDKVDTQKNLYYLGRITMLTKQLDVALTDYKELIYYKEYILEKLSLKSN